MAEQQQPIIIKRIKKGGHGHHGGAWKVAYADFVTAMMAFFLLLWLLSATNESQKEGIAEYFTPTIGLKDSMGIGFEGGEKPSEKGISKSDLSPPGIVVGQVPPGPIPNKPEQEAMVEAEHDSKLFEKAVADLKKTFEEDPNFRDLKDNIIVEQNPEGLKIQLLDLDKFPMFEPGKSTLTDYGEKMLRKISSVIIALPNKVSITGHTDSSGYSPDAAYTNWELSADRANASRRFLLSTQMEHEKVQKVVGMADRELLVPTDPRSARNRRISIILLRGSYLDMSGANAPAPHELLMVPKGKEKPAAKPAEPPPPPPPADALPAPEHKAPAVAPAAPAAPPATKAVPLFPMSGETKKPTGISPLPTGQ